MHEILNHLPAQARVLDLGSRHGSFDAPAYPFQTVLLDLDPPSRPGAVRGDAARLPFASGAFDAVVANHSLEHFGELEAALREIGRVLKPGGSLYVAVPDATTFTDRVYRWLARGGGHVNPFTSASDLAARIEGATALKLSGFRLLCTSLSFLNRRNAQGRMPAKIWLFGGGYEVSLRWLSRWLRWRDRRGHSRANVYGWAFYFGAVGESVSPQVRSNVCMRCGAGHASDWLASTGRVSGRSYRCPNCGAKNAFSRDSDFAYAQ